MSADTPLGWTGLPLSISATSPSSLTSRSLNTYKLLLVIIYMKESKKATALVIIRRLEYWSAGLEYPPASLAGCRARKFGFVLVSSQP